MNVYGGVIQELSVQVHAVKAIAAVLTVLRDDATLYVWLEGHLTSPGNCLADLNLVSSMAVAFIMMQLNGG